MEKTSHNEQWILDRWEGDFGVIEGIGPVPRALLPRGLREGDVLEVVADTDMVTITRDLEGTKRRRERLQHLRDELPKVDAGDDDVIEL